ncbi:MAG TPA: hypothetical protein VK904_04380 [Miltoncostaeaceae bacterium]|nr:hypothetical protein [Miltoncostaeaceae bacterium]
MAERALAQALHGVYAASRPARITPTRSATCCTSSREWDERKTVPPPAAASLISARTSRSTRRVEPAGGLVEHDPVGPVHEGLHQPELLAVALGELADGTAELGVQALAERIAARRVDPAAAQPGERGELLTAGEAVREPELAGKLADAPPRRDGIAPQVQAEQGHPAGGGPHQVQEEPDGRALAGPGGAGVAEDLPALDPEVEVGERRHPAGAGTSWRALGPRSPGARSACSPPRRNGGSLAPRAGLRRSGAGAEA